MKRIEELNQDIEKLEQIKSIYESTSDFLTGEFYSEFMGTVNEQIQELRLAIKRDTPKEFYAEWDEDSASYCVFDTESGFAYSSYASEEEAERDAEERNKRELEKLMEV